MTWLSSRILYSIVFTAVLDQLWLGVVPPTLPNSPKSTQRWANSWPIEALAVESGGWWCGVPAVGWRGKRIDSLDRCESWKVLRVSEASGVYVCWISACERYFYSFTYNSLISNTLAFIMKTFSYHQMTERLATGGKLTGHLTPGLKGPLVQVQSLQLTLTT